MPIFMDRHEFDEITAEDVASAHAEDLKVQDEFGCRGLTYWFDESRGTAFCLIEAPSSDAVEAMHRHAHGLVPNHVIEVEPGAVTTFLGRVADPESQPGLPIREPAFRAIMFTDMAHSTDITNQLGDRAAFEVLQAHHKIIRDALFRYGGHEIDTAGDGFLASFSSVPDAMRCAVAIQRDFEEHNMSGSSPVDIRVRIGLGAGEPVEHAGTLFGSTVNLTARICAHAEPNQILASHDIRAFGEAARVVFRPYGSVQLKGFPTPVELDEIEWRKTDG